MSYHIEYPRSLPAKRPAGHKPAAPRHGLRWSRPVTAIISDWFGIQAADLPDSARARFFAMAKASFAEEDGPDCHETFRGDGEGGLSNVVIVGYWTDALRHARWAMRSSLVEWFRDDVRRYSPVGAWRETVSVPYDRHETIYSENWYRVGIGRTQDSEIVSINQNGYFGAARDRLPISAIDPLESPYGSSAPRNQHVVGRGERLRVVAPLNMVTLRSGQYWAHAEGEQLEDYRERLQPKLMDGMRHLREHAQATGTLSLRILTNLDDEGNDLRETSVLAHFLSLKQLEDWSASHETHLAIYRHAIAMNRKHGAERQFVSWHELFVPTTACFEYVNCHPQTGLLPYFEATVVA